MVASSPVRTRSIGWTMLAVALALSGLSPRAIAQMSTVHSGSPFHRPVAVQASPDGATLYVADFGIHGIHKIPAAGGPITLLASQGSTGYGGFHHLRLMDASADGSTLFVAGWGTNQVFRVSTATGLPTFIASIPDAHGIALSPDETRLYVTQSQAGNLVSLPVGGGPVTTVATSLGEPLAVAISPDGADAFVVADGPPAVYRIPTSGGTPVTIGSQPPFYRPSSIQISPNGTTLFIVDDAVHTGGSQPVVYGMEIASGVIRPLHAGPPMAYPSGCGLSPSLDALYVADPGLAVAPGRALYRLALEGKPFVVPAASSTLFVGLSGLLLALGVAVLRRRGVAPGL